MKRGIKLFTVITLCIVLIISIVLATNQQNVQAILKKIDIVINGQKTNIDSLIYNGTAYVPVKVISEMLGKEGQWDEKTNTASVNDKKITTGYNFTNPAPIGKSQIVFYDNFISQSTLEITVKEVIRGSKASELIKAASSIFYNEPESGYEYLLAKIKVKAIEVKDGKKVDINSAIFKVYTGSGEEYQYSIIVEPKPNLNTSLYTGAETEGWAAYKVKVNDLTPKLGFGQSYDGTGGVWFKLSE